MGGDEFESDLLHFENYFCCPFVFRIFKHGLILPHLYFFPCRFVCFTVCVCVLWSNYSEVHLRLLGVTCLENRLVAASCLVASINLFLCPYRDLYCRSVSSLSDCLRIGVSVCVTVSLLCMSLCFSCLLFFPCLSPILFCRFVYLRFLVALLSAFVTIFFLCLLLFLSCSL